MIKNPRAPHKRERVRIAWRAIAERSAGCARQPVAGGARLKPEALAVKIGGLGINKIVEMSVDRTRASSSRTSS